MRKVSFGPFHSSNKVLPNCIASCSFIGLIILLCSISIGVTLKVTFKMRKVQFGPL